jgi:hypothetical protein
VSDEAERYPEGVYVQVNYSGRVVGELIRYRGAWHRPNGDHVLAGDIWDAVPAKIVDARPAGVQ